jgi:hypothetical protein
MGPKVNRTYISGDHVGHKTWLRYQTSSSNRKGGAYGRI